MIPRAIHMPATAALLLLLAAGPLVAQQHRITIRGIVVDGTTGEPIVGAYVGVRGTSKAVGTGTGGSFVLRDVQPGTLIEVWQIG